MSNSGPFRGSDEPLHTRAIAIPGEPRRCLRPTQDRHAGIPATASDEALLAALARGEQSALELLYDRYGVLAYRLAQRILQDRGTAEEVVRGVFLGAWRSAAALHAGRWCVRTWLLSAVHRDAIDRRRSKADQARQALRLDDAAAAGRPGQVAWDGVAWHVPRAQLRGALARLSPSQRQAVELAYFDGATVAEIAERQGLPPETVQAQLRLGLQTLQRELGQPTNLEATQA